jgi:drug/metabolite transporter (DMT)-like permease
MRDAAYSLEHTPESTQEATANHMTARNLQLFLACVLIWGSTWIAIKFQLGVVPPEVSVVWRFLLAAALLAGYCIWRGESLRFSWRTHRTLVLFGLFMFCFSYVCVYHAERFVVSGLVAVGYSASPLLNMIVSRIALGTPMSRSVALGGVLGVIGIALVFWPEFQGLDSNTQLLLGALLTAAAVITSTIGNVPAEHAARQGLSVWQQMTWGMAYGGVACLVYVLIMGLPLGIDMRASYLLSLLYLTVFGSVLAFAGYLILLTRIGAARAGYIGVMVPVVALIISSLFEGFRWQALTFVGIALALLGNVIVLRLPAPPHASTQEQTTVTQS